MLLHRSTTLPMYLTVAQLCVTIMDDIVTCLQLCYHRQVHHCVYHRLHDHHLLHRIFLSTSEAASNRMSVDDVYVSHQMHF